MSITALAEGTIPSEIGFPANSLCRQPSPAVHNLKRSDGFDSLIIKAGSAFYLILGHLGVEWGNRERKRDGQIKNGLQCQSVNTEGPRSWNIEVNSWREGFVPQMMWWNSSSPIHPELTCVGVCYLLHLGTSRYQEIRVIKSVGHFRFVDGLFLHSIILLYAIKTKVVSPN